jgi:hypothetical protein
MPNHLWLYFHGEKFFAVVNKNFHSDHFWQNNQVSHMSFYGDLFPFPEGFLGFAHLFQQYPLLRRQAPLETSPLSGRKQINEFVHGHALQTAKRMTAIHEFFRHFSSSNHKLLKRYKRSVTEPFVSSSALHP